MQVPMVVVIVGGFFAVVGLITTCIFVPDLIGAIAEGVAGD